MSGVDGSTPAPDMAMRDCSNPCKCAERPTPDFSGDTLGAVPDGSGPDQIEALHRGNHWRVAAGLAPFDGSAGLQQAALAHAAYLDLDKQGACWPDPHVEDAACAHYTGDTVGDRETAAGYSWVRASEVVNWESGPDNAIDRWLWSVYHRIPFMDFHMNDAGFATHGTSNVMDLATSRVKKSPKAPAVLPVFPVPGDTEVPVDFRGDLEEPTPPGPGGGGAWPHGVSSGQVVSLHFTGPSWKVTEHHIYNNAGGACMEVPHTMATKDTDANLQAFESNDVFLYADDVLDAGTEYVAVIGGTFAGNPFTRSWAFTTAE